MDYPTNEAEYKPTLCLNDKQFPVVKKLEAGKTYKMVVTAKAVEKSERSKENGEVKTHIDLEINDIQVGRGRAYERRLGV